VVPLLRQMTDLLQKDPDPEAVSKAGAAHPCSARVVKFSPCQRALLCSCLNMYLWSAEEVAAVREKYRQEVASSQAGMRKDRESAAPRQRLGPPGDDGWLPYGNPRAGRAAPAKEQAQPLPGDRICPECGGVNFKGKRGE